jgi:transmembrane sensor
MVEPPLNRLKDMDPNTGESALQAAQQWFVLLRDADATETDRRRFADWLAADPAHGRAWAETEQLWARMDAVVPVLRQRETWNERHKQSARLLSRRNWLRQAAAAALVVGGLAGYAASTDYFADHRTGIGERRSLSLADGSTVDLDAESALSVAFSAGQRRVTLHRGRAFFEVARDAARPFVVAANGGEVRALGTAFDVKIAPAGVVHVAVSEHAVAVSIGSESVQLGEGDALEYGIAGSRRPVIGPVSRIDIASRLGWRQNRLFFQEAPLREVVADLERYRPGSIFIADDDLAELPVTGFFHSSQTDAALQTIEATLPVRLTRLTDRLVVIRRR